MGIGKEGVAKLCEMLDMPFSISADTWYKHEEVLSQAHKEVTKDQLAKKMSEARRIAFQEGLDNDHNEKTSVGIPISFDGTWSKRGTQPTTVLALSYQL